MATALEVANELISLHPGQIDPMKLQKLVYFANGWWTAVKGRPLIDERPQVWRYGPVFQSLYRDFSRYGRSRIAEPERRSPFDAEAPRIGGDDAPEIRQMLDWIWAGYGHRSGSSLSEETHKEGTPWRRIAEESRYQVQPNEEIPVDADWRYFSQLAQQRSIPVAPLAA